MPSLDAQFLVVLPFQSVIIYGSEKKTKKDFKEENVEACLCLWCEKEEFIVGKEIVEAYIDVFGDVFHVSGDIVAYFR